MLRALWRILTIAFALIGLATVVGGTVFMYGGIGSRDEPGPFETSVARRLRSMAIPPDARNLKNPVPASVDAVEDGLAHFADHCAGCHANDGSGQTDIGRSLYPKAPDMRQRATQDLSDGELFYIIENGVKLTGMPAWGDGTPESETASWNLVHFVRRLPQLTDAELKRMEALNPRSPDEWRQQQEDQKSLGGESDGSKRGAPHTHRHGHK